MLEDQVLDIELQGCKGRDNDSARNPKSKHKLILNQTPSDMKQFFMNYQYGSPRVLSNSMPRVHRNLIRYRINRSLNFDIGSKKSNFHYLANANLDSFGANKSSRDLSRSARIMRALSFDPNLFLHRNANIKKSLTFDLTPSPKRNSSSSVGSSHTDSKIGTPSPVLDKVLRLDTSSTDSSASSILIASLDSIDENQNRTPQQSRKFTRNNTDKSESSNSSYSSLRSNLKEKIDEIVLMSDEQSLRQDNTPKTVNYDIATSTPRNLFQEFNKIDCDRPHTPENMVRLIPESMSAIKKSHKKERSYRHREAAQQKDISVRKEDSRMVEFEMAESSEMDKSTSSNCNMSSTPEKSTQDDQPQKKNINVKKMLTYDFGNEFFDTESFSTEKDTSQSINSDDAYMASQENVQDSDSILLSSLHHQDKDKENDPNRNFSKEEECQPLLQNKSLNDNNAGVLEQENRAVSLGSNPTTPQNSNRVVTPENRVNISEHMFTESIKKSHRKVKHENSKALFKSMILCHETTVSTPKTLNQSIQNENDNEHADINMSMNETCDLNSQNSVRSRTPENVSSSRLLLPQFSSVKKSRRKNKKLTKEINRRVPSFKYHDGYECCERNVHLLQSNEHKKKNISKILCRDKSHQLMESSPSISPLKKKKAMNAFLQSDTHELSDSVTCLSPEYKDMDVEFRIYTPIRRRMSPVLASAANSACADTISPEKDDSVSEEVDFSRCITPIARRSYRSDIKPRRGEFLSYEEHANIDRSKNDVRIIADNEPEDITHDENGRSTPLNMSTAELLCNIDSIKKSHKKNKHDNIICKRRIFGKEEQFSVKKAGNVNLEKHTTPSLKLNLDGDIHGTEMGVYSNKRNDNNKNRKTMNFYDDSQPSTSGRNNVIEIRRDVQTSKLTGTTPPNSRNTANFIKLLHTMSIKKSHKKERDRNAQTKYILMSKHHDLSDDGSIFDEEDRLTSVQSFDLCQDNDNGIIHS